MISRLTTAAALFAVLATATLAFAAQSPAAVSPQRSTTAVAADAALPIVVMPRVEVIGKRAR